MTTPLLPAGRIRGNPNRANPPAVIYLPDALDPEPELAIIITYAGRRLRTTGILTPDIGAALAALVGEPILVSEVPRQLELPLAG